MSRQNGPGTLHVGQRNRKYFLHDAEKRVERGLNGIPTPDRRVPVKNFLKHLGIGNKPGPLGNARLDQPPGLIFVRMRS